MKVPGVVVSRATTGATKGIGLGAIRGDSGREGESLPSGRGPSVMRHALGGPGCTVKRLMLTLVLGQVVRACSLVLLQ